MKSLELALCDLDDVYVTGVAAYIMENIPGVSINVFSACESFYSDSKEYDICIMSEDFEEIAEYKNQGQVKVKYILTEEKDDSREHCLFKYQSMEELLKAIPELNQAKRGDAGLGRSGRKTNYIGVYSPINHELQMPFSMALSNSYRDKGRVLFLDLEEISVLSSLLLDHDGRNMLDLIYEINATGCGQDYSEYVHHFMGMDYINPFSNPDEISQIDDESWKSFFNYVEGLGYETVIVLFGRAIAGFTDILGKFEKLYVLSKAGDFYRKSQEIFYGFIEKSGLEVDLEEVLLPMSANNLTEGAYCIEELLQGKLGVFVRKLLQPDTLKVAV